MVYQLYQDQNPESRSVADQWLQSLQSSEHAWSLAWPLLQHQVSSYAMIQSVLCFVFASFCEILLVCIV